eukprot:CAMPEP_0172814806 /NCGR_PEP_ID=MMETSP1075-20121228/11428_1 /TAXON_ID=2916 /ORGANISM="Ceratium fusus, Strain PA161109" /LENGTH=36 /DNA_ID= /DNA_START= /DNA_END= /DNA_ORIENTATION=
MTELADLEPWDKFDHQPVHVPSLALPQWNYFAVVLG